MDIDKLLEGRVNALVRRERNKYKRLFFKYKKALDELKTLNFNCSFDSNDSDEYFSESDDDDDELQDEEDCEEVEIDMIDLNDPETKRRIFDNINQNYNEGNGSRYSNRRTIILDRFIRFLVKRH